VPSAAVVTLTLATPLDTRNGDTQIPARGAPVPSATTVPAMEPVAVCAIVDVLDGGEAGAGGKSSVAGKESVGRGGTSEGAGEPGDSNSTGCGRAGGGDSEVGVKAVWAE